MQHQETEKELTLAHNNAAAAAQIHGIHGASHEANKTGSWRSEANSKPLKVVRTHTTRTNNHGNTGHEFYAS